MRLRAVLASKGNQVITIAPDADVKALVSLLSEHKVGALVVSADGREVAGIVSERDVIGALGRDGGSVLDAPVSSIATQDVHTARMDSSIDELMRLMTQERVRHIPVLSEDGSLAGIVSIGDVVKNHIGMLASERDALQDYVSSPR